ncbi:hypothetical protein NDU88_000747 [Pleurodeles waltl]|uniref:Uncharacterized protein n=1 Tax=Pleurodeles waltl TaxID=8319 RepID=A0AAV7NGZ4_PLEWA|nr:hypothetical protein NDU88_000747 [Pleurodeles waltl]
MWTTKRIPTGECRAPGRKASILHCAISDSSSCKLLPDRCSVRPRHCRLGNAAPSSRRTQGPVKQRYSRAATLAQRLLSVMSARAHESLATTMDQRK